MTMLTEPSEIEGLAAPSRMADLIGAYDWASTPLGDAVAWPQSLRTTVDIILSAPRAMCLAWGPDRVFIYNDLYALNLGTRHPHALGLSIQDVWPDVWPDIEPLVERTFAGEALTFDDMPLLMTRHGFPEETWWSFSYSPVRDEAGQVAGLLNITSETTARVVAMRERDAALVELREREQFLQSVLSSSNDCIKVLDLDARLVFMSEGGKRVMEVSDFNAIAGCPWPDFWEGSGNVAAREAIESVRAGKPAAFQGYADTMKGNQRYWDVQVSPILGPDAKPEKILSVSRDISALKASEEARTVLAQEMAHRMKNSLAMVQAIATQTLRQARTMDEGREAISSRLSALARAQDILTRSDFTEADVADVVGAAMAPHGLSQVRIEPSEERIILTSQQSLGLSLAIHELATNAAKYGALSCEEGHVAMSWTIVDGAFGFRWVESGGPVVVPPDRRGFGSKLIERIVAGYFDGEAHLDFDPAGVRFTLKGASKLTTAAQA